MKRYFKEVKEVNNGKKDFRWFVKRVFPGFENDWGFVLAAKRIFLEDGGRPERVKVDWVDFPDGITINTKF